MNRFPPLLLALPLVGCQPTSPADPPIPDPAAFAGWPAVTDRPVSVPGPNWLDCRGPSKEELVAHGPHTGQVIVVRVNPEAAAAFRDRRPVPVGTVVVKEKYSGDAADPLGEYAVMTKRPPGYDPGGGDWEYAHVRLHPERTTERGRLETCAGCHRMAAGGSGLFRTYLPK